jgi:hypothetical protein
MLPPKPYWRTRLHALAGVALGVSALALAGCSPKIGDHCVVNTDCGSSGTLVCDTSLSNGYCTQFNCTPDVCQNSAACVAFEPAVPGCPYDDYHSPARTTRTFCMAQCHSDSDCRESDGYICADPRQPPWNAAIIDDDQAQLVCIPGFSSSTLLVPSADAGLPEGSVCAPSGPAFPPLDGSSAETGEDAASDSGPAADAVGSDASGDGSGNTDAAAEAGDAGADAPDGEGSEAGTVDASGADAADAAEAGASDAQDEG